MMHAAFGFALLAIEQSAASRWIEVSLGITGVAILAFAAKAFLSPDAWGEGAEYEMLDLAAPREAPTRRKKTEPGTIGYEDRIVRFGFSLALGYLSVTWFGIGSLAMWCLAAPVFYFGATAAAGRDPIYRRLGVSTLF